jgi:Ni/Fe-hydrogenase subunit HybB-like protein
MVLWLLVGVAGAVAVVRYLQGLGVTTALTDLTPWGLWIGFDVLAGVALAAGGFVTAAAVHIFHRERYHALLRPAILTAFLGYVAVVLGLLVDLGKPWNIWRPTIFWQPHSALFEVAWCVMLYLTVLALEFAPVIFEGLRWNKAFNFMRRLTLPLVIVGIALSTLHQSSLGTLLVIAPNRLHPLWYSPLLPLLFLVSAVALGLAMVTVESLASAWLFHREPEWPPLHGLTRAARVVLAVFLVLRLGDLAWRGQLDHALEGSWASGLFLFELLLSTVGPILLFTLPSARSDRKALAVGAVSVVAGFVLNRADAGGISHIAATGDAYLPATTEIAVSLGVVAAMALVFLFFVEHLRVWESPPAGVDHFRPALIDPVSSLFVRGPWLGSVQRGALAWVVGALLGVVITEAEMARRAALRPSPVQRPRTAAVLRLDRGPAPGHRLVLTSFAPGPEAPRPELEGALLLGGERSGRYVLFEHDRHQQRLGGVGSCGVCHHRNVPLDRATSCAVCHRDVYAATDTFDHERHVHALGSNRSCDRCHRRPEEPKTRAAAKPCDDCHARDVSRTARFKVKARDGLQPGVARGYRAAMHGLCISCHRENEQKSAITQFTLSRCPNCHRDTSSRGEELRLREGWLDGGPGT